MQKEERIEEGFIIITSDDAAERERERAMIGQIWEGRYANLERTSSAVERPVTAPEERRREEKERAEILC